MNGMYKGKRIYLRTVEPSDTNTLLRWENDPGNWRVSGTMVPFSRHLIEQYVNSAQDIYRVRQVRFMICLLDDETPIGAIDLFDFEPKHLHAGVGILVDTAYRQKGFAAEALNLLETYAVDALGLKNLYCTILEDNTKSIYLFEGRGYQRIGHKRNWFNAGGKWLDEYLYQKELTGA